MKITKDKTTTEKVIGTTSYKANGDKMTTKTAPVDAQFIRCSGDDANINAYYNISKTAFLGE